MVVKRHFEKRTFETMEKIISKNMITAIPGIGIKYAKRLDAVGIKKPCDLLKQYEKLDKDPHRFVYWMKKQCHANSGHAKKTFDVVRSFNSAEKSILDDDKTKESLQPQRDQTRKKYSIDNPKLMHTYLLKNKMIKSDKLFPLTSDDNQSISDVLPPSGNPKEQNVPSLNGDSDVKHSDANKDKGDVEKDVLNQHLLKLREQFSSMHDTTNQKMLELQSELCKMQCLSHEFDVLAEFLNSEEKLSIFEQNLDRLQKTVCLTEEKIHEINTSNHKMGRMISQINDTARKQHENNNMAINAIGERLARWELKLDRVARKISNQKIDVEELKLTGGDYDQLKNDIKNVMNERLSDLSIEMEKMKNIFFCIISLIVIKMFIFDLFKDTMVQQQ